MPVDVLLGYLQASSSLIAMLVTKRFSTATERPVQQNGSYGRIIGEYGWALNWSLPIMSRGRITAYTSSIKKSSSSDNSNLKLRITAILIIIAVDSPGQINGTRLSFSQVCLYVLL